MWDGESYVMTSSVYFGRYRRQMLVWISSDSWSCRSNTTVVIDSLCSQWTEAPPKQLPKSILNWESKVNEMNIVFFRDSWAFCDSRWFRDYLNQ